MDTKFGPVRVEDLRRFAPRAKQPYIAALTDGWPMIEAAGINTPLRWCHFMAQCFHETGGFTIVREHTTWSETRMCALWPNRFKMVDPVFRLKYRACGGSDSDLAELAYGPGNDLGRKLGNTEEGDGWAYRGGSFLQGTGRAWYREVGQAIGHDLEGSPDLIENPTIGLQAALWVWSRYKLNGFADANNGRAIGNQINRGNPFSKHEPIGAPERRRAYDRAWAIWGNGATPAKSQDIDVGSHGPEVVAIQLRLKELRYGVGNADGVFGPETRRAVAAFKADWIAENGGELEPNARVGARTKAALAEAVPIERPERAEATVKDLAAAGSTEVKAGQQIKGAGAAATAIGAAGIAQQTGVLDTVQNNVGWLPAAQSTLAPAIDAVKWATTNLLFVGLVALGLIVYYRGHLIEQARLMAHRLGLNLGR